MLRRMRSRIVDSVLLLGLPVITRTCEECGCALEECECEAFEVAMQRMRKRRLARDFLSMTSAAVNASGAGVLLEMLAKKGVKK